MLRGMASRTARSRCAALRPKRSGDGFSRSTRKRWPGNVRHSGASAAVRRASSDAATVSAMTENLAHRGPDGSGQFADDVVVLGHRRLSIIDLATGDQPFVNADRSLALVYNGELYNYLELREELARADGSFARSPIPRSFFKPMRSGVRTASRGSTACGRLHCGTRGIRRLFCARDRLGEKPFFYAESLRRVSVRIGNEGAVRCGQAREINEEMLDAILCFTFLPAPYTLIRDPEASGRLLPDRERRDEFPCSGTGRCRRIASRSCAATRRESRRSSRSCLSTAFDCECAATSRSARS